MPAHRIIMISTSLVLAIGMIRGESPFKRYFQLKDSKEVLAETVAGLEKEISLLSSELEKINKSPNYAQRVLRDKYHVTDKNESIVFFAD